jgi:UDP-4-amino-4,6-dideoxy-N-acetyl-beta-L-altrosamine transaminase
MIRYGKQYIDKFDQKAVISALKSNWITQGPRVEIFERNLKNRIGSKFCSAVSNGTAALHLTALALGWKKNDIILCSSISFLSASNAVIYAGAKPDFVDISLRDYNIDIEKLKKKIKLYYSKNKKIKAIIATDFAGNPCNWKELKKISKKNNITLINDNCHAFGASYEKNKKYAIKYADVVTQSFHPVKNITTGEGGAILTNNKEIYNKVKLLRSHGVVKSLGKNQARPWYYEMRELGYNYRITDLQCALGTSQLKKLNKFIKRKNQIAKIYNSFFKDFKAVTIPRVKENCLHGFHLYPLLIDFKKLKISRSFLFKRLKSKNIILQVHYIPIHFQPFYRKNFKFKVGDYPVAEKFYTQEVSLPIFYSLKNSQVLYICKLIKKTLKLNDQKQ